ncbi:MAG: prolyl oligopeptidase family serine peptidase [Planctomycetota bacterium]|nr:prolyl oligopeptidase family serine peptidase [Planctomycetota bacterium]
MRTHLTAVSLASLAFLCPSFAWGGPPPTRTDPVTETMHGDSVVDPYRWLESLESESSEVREWTDAQNAFTRATLEALPCRDALTAELTPLMEIGAVGLPRRHGHSVFYTERTGRQNQAVLKVRAIDGTESRVLIDPNTLDARGLTSLDWWNPSKDGTLLAFGTSQSGSEMSELHLLVVATGAMLTDTISGKVDFGGWTPANDAFVYSALRDVKDPYSRESRWHVVGSDPAKDLILVKQDDPKRIPYVGLSEDGRWFFVGLTDGWQRNDLWIASTSAFLSSGTLTRIPIAVGLDGQFEPQVDFEERFVMRTTLDAPKGKLLAVDFHHPESAHWKTVVAERADAVLTGSSRTTNAMLVTWEKDVHSEVSIHNQDGAATGAMTLPGLGSATVSANHQGFDAFVSYTSYNCPRTILHFNTPSGASTTWAQPAVPADLSSISVTQHFTPSKDGTKIPYFIICNKDVKPTGANPCLLYGYGGFNVSLTPYFQSTIIPWLSRGGVYVVANLRGGAEYGEAWHQAGMQAKKQNVFDDLYAVANALTSQGWTNAAHLAIEGGSNGGLLTGVAVTQRPELFSCAISAVPLLDMLRFHKFLIAQYWVPEYGSSDDAAAYPWLKAYSPYQNVKSGRKYPAVLFTAGENDSRVHPLHARKMAALLQSVAANGPEDPILLWVDRDAGHGQGKPLALRVRDEVDQWSFVMWQTGLCESAKR